MNKLFLVAALFVSLAAQAQTPKEKLNGLVGCYDVVNISGDSIPVGIAGWKARIKFHETKHWLSPAPSTVQSVQVIAGPLAPNTKNFEVAYQINQETYLNVTGSYHRQDGNGNLNVGFAGTLENNYERITFDDSFAFFSSDNLVLAATTKSWVSVRGDHPTQGARRVHFSLKRVSCE